ncbi:MAG: YggS family pyridoxal phosphate-dependent enzyme [Eubacterium sp.]|nr:YggS family pyridoxal phosphate-dependent enzyme [Eubacterium sp.]
MLKENLKDVQGRIQEACQRSGRDPREVTLVAVSKKKPLSDIEELLGTGQMEYGENYVQELCEKYEKISSPVHWHMIGHLQRNKVKYIIDKVALIHSVDSFSLAEQIEKEAAKKGKIAEILLQVNVAHEETKFGLDLQGVTDLAEQISRLAHVRIRGLMTSAPYVSDPEENRGYFRALHQLFIDIRSKNIDNVSMDILSMGMTNDFEVAIEEGATMIRVGTAIFGER